MLKLKLFFSFKKMILFDPNRVHGPKFHSLCSYDSLVFHMTFSGDDDRFGSKMNHHFLSLKSIIIIDYKTKRNYSNHSSLDDAI